MEDDCQRWLCLFLHVAPHPNTTSIKALTLCLLAVGRVGLWTDVCSPPGPQLLISEVKQTFFPTRLACLLAFGQQAARHTHFLSQQFYPLPTTAFLPTRPVHTERGSTKIGRMVRRGRGHPARARVLTQTHALGGFGILRWSPGLLCWGLSPRSAFIPSITQLLPVRPSSFFQRHSLS